MPRHWETTRPFFLSPLPAAASRWCSLPAGCFPKLLPSGRLLSLPGLPRSGNFSAQTSASLHPPAALRLRVLPFTRTWSSTVCAEEFPTPLEMSLHGLPLLRHSKSFGPSAPIAYATCVSPPDEAAAWPAGRCQMANDVAAPGKPMRLQRGRCCRSAGVLHGVLPQAKRY